MGIEKDKFLSSTELVGNRQVVRTSFYNQNVSLEMDLQDSMFYTSNVTFFQLKRRKFRYTKMDLIGFNLAFSSPTIFSRRGCIFFIHPSYHQSKIRTNIVIIKTSLNRWCSSYGFN